jgi:hexosaminidase
LETLYQLVDTSSASLVHANVAVSDGPQYSWRGLMVDSGRRFFPVPLLENLMDTMAGAKLNVLHLHASDMCRFGVESKVLAHHTPYQTHKDLRPNSLKL